MSALDQRLVAEERRHRLSTGPGAKLHRTGFGAILRFDGRGADFGHPWLAELAGSSAATFLPGVINTIPATIDGVPLAGTDTKSVPQLTWKKLQLTPDGIGFFCAEVTCDPKQDFAVLKAEIVQVADPDTDDGKPGKTRNATGGALPLRGDRARWPLAMLQQRASGLVEVFQITFFDLTHRVKLAEDGESAARHFFF